MAVEELKQALLSEHTEKEGLREQLDKEEIAARNAATEAELARKNLEALKSTSDSKTVQYSELLEAEQSSNAQLSEKLRDRETRLAEADRELQELRLAKVGLEGRVLQLEREANDRAAKYPQFRRPPLLEWRNSRKISPVSRASSRRRRASAI